MSTTKTNSELLASIKQSNKTARETRAQKLGFAGSKELIVYLEIAIKQGEGNKPFTPNSKSPTAKSSGRTKTKPAPVSSGKTKTSSPSTIHVVDILDASGSMIGGKFEAALVGINTGIRQLGSDKANVKYTYTLCDFSDEVIFRYTVSSLSKVETVRGNTRSSTALFDAIGKTIDTIKGRKDSGDKVLVNIYTDGQENSSRKYKGVDISNAIVELSKKGWTFTFIGMEEDVKYAQERLNFQSSNTLVYDGTAKGLEKSFIANNLARSAYSSKVEKGEDVSTGFYKDIK